MPGWSSRGVFLSYRREDAAPYARLLKSEFRERIPSAQIFMDLDSIEAGTDFAEVIRAAVDSCAVLVALIGRRWATLTDEDGRRRLDDPDDYVRFEVRVALERGARVIPVLLDGAEPLQKQDLPADLHKLARLNAFELSYNRYEDDADRLVDLIQRVLTAVPSTETANQSPRAESTKVLSIPRNSRPHRYPLLTDAERIARSINNDVHKGSALADVAEAVAVTDATRAALLLAEAERMVRSSWQDYSKPCALANIAKVVGVNDPARAERMVQSISDEVPKDLALEILAGALAAGHPDRAERIAQSIANQVCKARALADIAKAVVTTDPARTARLIANAEHQAWSIVDDYTKAGALANIAGPVAAIDPDRAERVAQSIPFEDLKVSALARVSRAMAAIDPDRAARLIADAERVALFMTDKQWESKLLAQIAGALVVIDSDRAFSIAQSIKSEFYKSSVLAKIAGKLANTDSGHAESITQSITNKRWKILALLTIAEDAGDEELFAYRSDWLLES